ncbi:MAG: putative lipid II flippase FtsW [Elusimicrobia bacterium]|nr:putative lipid II flippase FtsW [Elusimicrobiota bacterium]
MSSLAPRRARSVDPQLLGWAAFMLVGGILALYSASAILADKEHGDAFFYLKRQGLFAAAGTLVMAALMRVSYQRLREWIWLLLPLTALALVAVLFAPKIGGARRWLHLGPFGLQPAEFAKLTVLLFLADYLDRKRSRLQNAVQGLVVPWGVVGLLLGLILLEPDLGTPVLIFAVTLGVLFVGGARVRYVVGAVLAALPLAAWQLWAYPYRRARLLSFLDPFADASGTGYQLSQSLLAVGSGGWFGKGPGLSDVKLLYLPAPHTDFIYPVLCEELGVLGGLSVLGLFAWFLSRGLSIARRAPDLYGTLLAAGVTFLVSLQAFFNMAMSLGLIPTKGLPLPFISYGGSSLLVTMAATGILLNISRHAAELPRR